MSRPRTDAEASAPDGSAAAASAPHVAGAAASVRPATRADVPEILRLVRELAAFERSLPEVSASEDDLAQLLFGTNTPSGSPAAFCHVVDDPSAGSTGRLAAFALWFLNASTWLGRHGIYLEDLYVSPQHRGRGYGQALVATLARICVDRGYGRLEWWVLDWNEVGRSFYARLGAVSMDEWTTQRLTGDTLARLAEGAPTP